MLILLPPSEAKAAADRGYPVDFAELSFPQLTEARERVAEALIEISAHDDSLDVLKVGKSLSTEVARNTRIFKEPALSASDVYTGVLYEALSYSTLNQDERAEADTSLLVFSALWGVLRMVDKIPAYRLSMGVKLGNCGNLASFWKGELTSVLDEYAGDQLILDCRSSAYTKAWVPAPHRTFAVRVVREDVEGNRKVISHMAKHYRGELARYLITNQLTRTENIEELLQILAHDWQVELSQSTNRKPGTLTLVIQD